MKGLITLFVLTVFVAAADAQPLVDAGVPVLVAPTVDDARGLPPIAAPAPEPDPVATVNTVTKLWRSGAIPSAIIVAAFFVLVILRNRVQWFHDHGWATWMSLAIGGLAVAVDAVQRGDTPNMSMMLTALTTTLALAARMPSQGRP